MTHSATEGRSQAFASLNAGESRVQIIGFQTAVVLLCQSYCVVIFVIKKTVLRVYSDSCIIRTNKSMFLKLTSNDARGDQNIM
jgi:hypothetical protein